MTYKEPKEVNEQDIKKAFEKAEIPIDKIVKSKFGGYYVYTPYGMSDSYIKYIIVERGEGFVKKLREKIPVKRCFIDNQDLLEMSIAEAITRKKYS
jgi:hypothetical protein